MKLLVIDGQGGRIGRMLVEGIKRKNAKLPITALGSNIAATTTMLKAGADEGASGENPIIYNANNADIIVGPIGIIVANALLGEITPAMATAVAGSPAQKFLIPVSKCNSTVIGVQELTLTEYIEDAITQVVAYAKELRV